VNILDENIVDNQVRQLLSWRISIRQIGHEIGRMGMADREIISLLHQLDRPTLFTRDADFYDRSLCHARYCLVHLDTRQQEVAVFVRRFLRHQDFNTRAKRMGKVVRVSQVGSSVWRLHGEKEDRTSWQ
jgi:predicted nuclease of predicted toxin-antitoxin system